MHCQREGIDERTDDESCRHYFTTNIIVQGASKHVSWHVSEVMGETGLKTDEFSRSWCLRHVPTVSEKCERLVAETVPVCATHRANGDLAQ